MPTNSTLGQSATPEMVPAGSVMTIAEAIYNARFPDAGTRFGEKAWTAQPVQPVQEVWVRCANAAILAYEAAKPKAGVDAGKLWDAFREIGKVERGDVWSFPTWRALPDAAQAAFAALVAETGVDRDAPAGALASVEEIIAILEPFASGAGEADKFCNEARSYGMNGMTDADTTGLGVTFGHLRAARELRNRLIDQMSYTDLRASGGIREDAPAGGEAVVVPRLFDGDASERAWQIWKERGHGHESFVACINAYVANATIHPAPLREADREAVRNALEEARQAIVLTIAFLGRDEGTDRLPATITGLIECLAWTPVTSTPPRSPAPPLPQRRERSDASLAVPQMGVSEPLRPHLQALRRTSSPVSDRRGL